MVSLKNIAVSRGYPRPRALVTVIFQNREKSAFYENHINFRNEEKMVEIKQSWRVNTKTVCHTLIGMIQEATSCFAILLKLLHSSANTGRTLPEPRGDTKIVCQKMTKHFARVGKF
jgi:hypothetical protein